MVEGSEEQTVTCFACRWCSAWLSACAQEQVEEWDCKIKTLAGPDGISLVYSSAIFALNAQLLQNINADPKNLLHKDTEVSSTKNVLGSCSYFSWKDPPI